MTVRFAAIHVRTESGDSYTTLERYRDGYPELLIADIQRRMGEEFAYIYEVTSDFESDLGEYDFDHEFMEAVYAE